MTPRYPDTPHRRHALQSLTTTEPATETPARQQSHSTNPLLAEFSAEMKRLSDEIDGFKMERQRWRDKLDTESEVSLSLVHLEAMLNTRRPL